MIKSLIEEITTEKLKKEIENEIESSEIKKEKNKREPSFIIKPLEQKPFYTLEDFIKYHGEEFIRFAYRHILCREPDPDVTPKVLEEIGFTAEQASRAKAFKGKGCPKCKDSGYKGRMGIYEILNISKPVKEAILRKATTPELKEIAIKEGFQTMQEMGKRMIASGDLNFREYERVLSSS